MFSLAFHSSGFFMRSGVCFLSSLLLSPFRLFSSAVCSSDSSLFLFHSPFACHSLSRYSSLPFLRFLAVGCVCVCVCYFLFFAHLFRGSPPLLPVADIPPCPVASFSFGSLHVCSSVSVPHALRLLWLFPFSSCLLTCRLSSSFAFAQLYFGWFCCLFLLVARVYGSFLCGRCLLLPPLLGCFRCVGNPASGLSARLCSFMRVFFSSAPLEFLFSAAVEVGGLFIPLFAFRGYFLYPVMISRVFRCFFRF